MTSQAKSFNSVLLGDNLGESTTYTCANRDPKDPDGTGALGFMPVLAGVVTESEPQVNNFKGQCFDSISWEYEKVSDTKVNVIITTENPKSQSCQEYIMYGNTEFIHMEVYFGVFAGTHTIGPFEFTGDDALADLAFGGIKMFQFCDTIQNAAASLVSTLKFFVGGLGMEPSGIKSSHIPVY